MMSLGAAEVDGGRAGGSESPEAARASAAEPVPLLDAVRALRAGTEVEASFASLDSLVRPRLRSYFRAHCFAPEAAEDLVQKTLLRVYQGVGQLRVQESFLAWLFAIARNVRRTARGRERRDARVLAPGVEPDAETPDPRPGLEDGRLMEERVTTLREAIEQLPPQQRQCLLLRVHQDLSYEEVAQTLRLSVHTVRNHLASARRTLRLVDGLEGGDGR
jgi:RNA polymerase sigma-70 factor (ECF subfamily)